MSEPLKKIMIGLLGLVVLILVFGLKNGWFKSDKVEEQAGYDGYEKVAINENKKARMDVVIEQNKQKIDTKKLNRKIKSIDRFYQKEKNHKPFEADDSLEINPKENEVIERSRVKNDQKEIEVKYIKIKHSVEEMPLVAAVTSTKRRRSKRNSDNAFYGSNESGDTPPADKKGSEFTKAVIHGDHTLRSGDNVNIRLTDDLIWNGNALKRGSFINGKAQMQRGRMFIEVSDLMVKNHVVKVDAKIYDGKDASEGLYVPGGVDKEIKDDLLNDAINESALSVNIPLVGTIRSGAKKKSKERIVKILSGHKILIKISGE